MFLKSLELNGFKSFASKTLLEFPAGITAVVGPNGAGKSNLIDAIRWLLGEREAKNLRSAKAEDLIFNGTPKKSRMSLAQAGLHFNNDSGFFPVDFKEVSVVRKVGRDGISQYFLNKTEVRLKDVIDFFSRSRLGTKGLSIINQGDSDLFIKASPEERRIMIEEILGLREYQIKKIEAERKLKNTSFNLEKVRAMISEVAPRLRMLKCQTNKWAKRLDLQKELEELENNYFSYKLSEIETGQSKINPVLKSLETRIDDKEKELKILESEIKKIESRPKEEYQEIRKIKNQQSKLLVERSQIQKELGRLEAKLEFLGGSPVRNNISNGVSQRDDGRVFKNEDLLGLIHKTREILKNGLTQSSFEELKKVIEELVAEIDRFLNSGKDSDLILKSKELADLPRNSTKLSLRGLEELKNNLETKFNNLEKELKKLEEQETEFTTDLEKFNEKFQEAFESVEAKRKELRGLEEEKNKVLFEKEKLNLKLQDLENQLRQIGKTTDELSASGGQINSQELPEIERRIFKLRGELAAIGEIDESLVKEAQEVENHYDFLTSQSKDLDKAIIDLKKLIKELSEKIHFEFNSSLRLVNEEFNKFFRLMFDGGNAKIKIKNYAVLLPRGPLKVENNGEEEVKEINEEEVKSGVDIDLSLPKKKITTLEMLSGGERSLVSIAALFALISISPPPFLVLDEIDAALDENNSKRFANLIKEFSQKTQFVIVTHNRSVMEAADVLYGITMGEEGTSKVLSLKLESNARA